MPLIPSNINGVEVQFADGVDRDVDQRMIDGLTHCIRPFTPLAETLAKIWISSASDSHDPPSRHAQRKAVDVSRLNGVFIAEGYPRNGGTTALVDAIQDAFESFAGRRENFGPHFKKKHGQPFEVAGHHDHIHLSVD